ncbi:MAG: hypothetical protein RIA71_16115 [Oceanicaulis sp.]
MILDNLTRAFKTQNWLAAATEFVIVIAGVVIGFQINAWNEGRTARLQEAVIEANLAEDFRGLIADIDDAVRRTVDIARNATVVVETLDRGGVEAARADQFETGLISLVWSVPTPQSPSTLQELVSSGGLSRLTDPSLRAALSQFLERRESVNGMSNSLVQARFTNAQRRDLPIFLDPGSVADLEAAYQSGAYESIAAYSELQGVRSTLARYDFDAMRADPAIRDMYVTSRDLNNTYLSWLVSLRDSAQEVVDHLEDAETTP